MTNEEVFVVSNRRRGRKPSKFIRESHSTEGSVSFISVKWNSLKNHHLTFSFFANLTNNNRDF